MLESKIIEKPDLHVVGLEAPFIHAMSPDANNAAVIGPLWDRFIGCAGEVRGRIGHDMVGIIYGRPPAERGHRDELQYIAGVPVHSVQPLPAGMVAHTVPAGTFAVFIHRGPIRNIAQTVGAIYQQWLPGSTWRHAQIADVEWYGERFCADGPESEMEYWLSVTPKTGG